MARLIGEGKLRLFQTDRPVSGITFICAEELYQILVARQKRDAG